MAGERERAGRTLNGGHRPRTAWALLALAMGVATAAILYSGRGTGFFFDEVSIYTQSSWHLRDLFRPHNGQLFIFPRLFYQLLLDTAGPDYRIARAGALLGVLAVGLMFFVYAKRRVGPWLALPPAVLLLLFGSAWPATLWPVGANFAWAIAAGIAALILLERKDLIGDVAACAMLLVSVGCSAAGLAFVAGAAVAIILGGRTSGWAFDRGALARRCFVFIVPVALFGAWYLWSLQFDQGRAYASNVLVIPNFIADSAGASLAALTGYSYNFLDHGVPAPDASWGPALSVLAVAALVVRIRAGEVPAALWVWLAVLLTFWTAIALGAGQGRTPEEARYLYLGGVGILAIAVEAVRDQSLPRATLVAGAIVLAVAIPANLRQLYDGGRFLREESRATRVQLGMIELARDQVPRSFNAFAEPYLAPVTRAGDYLRAADRFGPLGFSPSQVLVQSEGARQNADLVLSRALGLRLIRAPSPADGRCGIRPRSGGNGVITAALPPGGALLAATDPARLKLRRFGKLATVDLGALSPGHFLLLRIPEDSFARPWHASIETVGAVSICPLPAT